MSTQTFPPYQAPTGTKITFKNQPGEYPAMQMSYETQAKQYVANVLVPMFPAPDYACGYVAYRDPGNNIVITTDPGATPADLWEWFVTDKRNPDPKQQQSINGFVGFALEALFKDGVGSLVSIVKEKRGSSDFPVQFGYVYGAPKTKTAPVTVVTLNASQLALMAG